MKGRDAPALPPFPSIELVTVGERDPSEASPWVARRRPVMVARTPAGDSEPFTYDLVERQRLDAVVVVPHFRDATGARHVYLRSALRPPVALRPAAAWPVPELPTLGHLWEVVAGLVE